MIDTSAEVIDTGLDKVQDVARNVQQRISSQSNFKNKPFDLTANINTQPADIMANNTLNKALNTSAQTRQLYNGSSEHDYVADESQSTIQTGGGKSGWCFIGEDRGFRSCVEIGANDQCMSGDIFPTMDICVNPNLRT